MKHVFLIVALVCSLSAFAQTSTRTIALHYPESSLTQLQPGDTLTIQYSSMGCFGDTKQKLLIIQQGNGYQAERYIIPETYDKQEKKMVQHADSLVNTAILTEQNIQDFAQFEYELTQARKANCTTVDTYIIKSKYLNMEKTDGSCQWNGFYHLTRSFFGVNP